jgi:Flp pilus assembly protein TadD
MSSLMRAQRNLGSTIALAALALGVLALPLLRGGVDWPVQTLAAALLLVGWAAGAAGLGTVPAPALALGAVVAGIGLQLLPLPSWAHALSPAARRTFEAALGPLGLYPAARPLSLDPPETGRALLHATAVLSAFSCAAAFAEARSRRSLLVLALAASGTLVGALVLGAALLGLGPLLAPSFPFVNPNHLASACCFSALVALGLAVRHHGGQRVLWLLAFVVSGSVVLLSLSRAGILALLLGCGLFAALLLRPAPGEEPGVGRRPALLGLAVALVLAVVALLALDPVLGELRTLRGAAQESKAQLLPIGLRMATDFPLLGIGRGAFATVFAGYKSDPVPLTFTHLENSWLQPIIDLGWPLGLLLVGTFAWLWLRAARRPLLSPTDIGLLAATAAVAIHDGADFSLELLGVAVPFAVAMGLLAREVRWLRVPRAALLAAAALLAGLAGGGLLLNRTHPTERDEQPIVAAPDAASADAAARAAVAWHPADFLPQAVAGARWVAARRCREAFPWLLRAMTLNPTAAEPHRLLAGCFASAGQPQLARREYRLALAYGDASALGAATASFPALADLLEIVADTPDALFGLAQTLAGSRKPDAVVVFRRLLETFADDRAELPLARLLLEIGDPAAALEVARRRTRSSLAEPEAYCLAAAALDKLGRGADALAELERGLASDPGASAIISALADRSYLAKRYSESSRLASQMAIRNPAEAAARDLLIARALAAQGRYSEAIERTRAAAAARPDWPAPLESLASLCRTAHRYGDAIAALEAARTLSPDRAASYERELATIRAEQTAQEEERRRLLLEEQLPSSP